MDIVLFYSNKLYSLLVQLYINNYFLECNRKHFLVGK